MNRKERRHPPEQESPPKPPEPKELLGKSAPDDELSVRAKSHRHKKVTADKWNQ